LANMETKTLAINFNAIYKNSTVGDQMGQKVNFEKLKIKPQGGRIKLTLIINLEKGVKCTEDAPQKWQLDLPANGLWRTNQANGSLLKNKQVELDLTVPSERENKGNGESLLVTFKLNLCSGDVCFPKLFSVNFPINYDRNGQDCIIEDVNVYVNRINVKI
jgi:hypothetical protein